LQQLSFDTRQNAMLLIYREIQLPASKNGSCSDGNGDFMGELTPHSNQKMIKWLIKDAGLTEESIFLDGGSAFNIVPNHVAQMVNCRTWGIEMNQTRVSLGAIWYQNVITESRNKGTVLNTKVGFVCKNLEEYDHFGETTHAYFFDEAFTKELLEHCVKAASNTPSIQYILTFKQSKQPSLSFIFSNMDSNCKGN
jgi:hypothetical protein